MSGERYREVSLSTNNSRLLVALGFIKLLLTTRARGRLLKVQRKKLTAEEFKGIEFIQIGSLSSSQKKLLWQSPASKKIFSILRDKELLHDCLSYKDYSDFIVPLL